MIDSHCHLNLSQFEDDFEETVSRALLDGITAFNNIGYDEESVAATMRLVSEYPFFFGAIGVHPHDAERFDDEFEGHLREHLSHPRILAVGEIGLDFYRDLSPREVQRDVFRRMLLLARDRNKPIVIHCRDAFDDVITVLQEEGNSYRGIFHAFEGDAEAARRVIDLGFHIGIGGVSTFNNSALLRTVSDIPMERIVLETDSPYLTPHPYRGHRNEPAFVAHVARRIARVKDFSVDEVIEQTTDNFARAMGLTTEALPGPIYRLGDTVYIHTARLGEADVARLDDIAPGEEIEEMIMCGWGESLEHLDRVRTLAEYGKGREWRVRVNTNGQGNRIAGRDVTAELHDVVDEFNVVFYGTTSSQHDQITLERGGDAGFEAMREFVRCSVAAKIETVCEFIAVPKFNPEACRKFAKDLKAQYDIRMYRSKR